MTKLALFARLDAKPGMEAELEKFLEQGLLLAHRETTTPVWFALKLGKSQYGIFDAFTDESGREAHLSGPIASALMSNASRLLAHPRRLRRSTSSAIRSRPIAPSKRHLVLFGRVTSKPKKLMCPTIWTHWSTPADYLILLKISYNNPVWGYLRNINQLEVNYETLTISRAVIDGGNCGSSTLLLPTTGVPLSPGLFAQSLLSLRAGIFAAVVLRTFDSGVFVLSVLSGTYVLRWWILRCAGRRHHELL